MISSVSNGNAFSANILTINNARRSVEDISSRISSGNRVNSAIDNPYSYFESRELSSIADSYSRISDNISNSLDTLSKAIDSISSIINALQEARTAANNSLIFIKNGQTDSSVYSNKLSEVTSLSTLIENDSPVAYYRFNDTNSTALNRGSGGVSLNATYVGNVTYGADGLYQNDADSSVEFDGISGGLRIPDSSLINTSSYPERTVELVFKANDITSKQVLFEEGATVNGLTIYIDDGDVFVTAEDNGNYSDISISAPIEEDTTYHVAFVFDRPNNSFTGYLNGENIGSAGVGNQVFPGHSGDVGAGYAPDGVQFGDGESSSGGFNFNGFLSDLAIYNSALSADQISERSNSLTGDFEYRNSIFDNLLSKIDTFAENARFKSTNLLRGSDLHTTFNPEGTNSFSVSGQDIRLSNMNIRNNGFDSKAGVQNAIWDIDKALDEIDSFSSNLSNAQFIIETRSSFTDDLIDNHSSGATDLTLADLDKEKEELAEAKKSLLYAQEALNIGASSEANMLKIYIQQQTISSSNGDVLSNYMQLQSGLHFNTMV